MFCFFYFVFIASNWKKKNVDKALSTRIIAKNFMRNIYVDSIDRGKVVFILFILLFLFVGTREASTNRRVNLIKRKKEKTNEQYSRQIHWKSTHFSDPYVLTLLSIRFATSNRMVRNKRTRTFCLHKFIYIKIYEYSKQKIKVSKTIKYDQNSVNIIATQKKKYSSTHHTNQ